MQASASDIVVKPTTSQHPRPSVGVRRHAPPTVHLQRRSNEHAKAVAHHSDLVDTAAMTKKIPKLSKLTSKLAAAAASGLGLNESNAQTSPQELLAAVVDHDGLPVAKDALSGHWSVLWFYPKAQTGG